MQEAEHVSVGTCRDGLLNADELDVDCGPSCNASCAIGKPCTADAECQSGFCAQGVCSTPSCSDNTKNRTETDVDCGGSDGCKACTVGQRCASVFDCDGGECNNGRCQAPSCSDGIQNQDESDVDCGGGQGCDRCSTKQHCSADTDCFKAKCAQGRCQAESCNDGVQNGSETDVDCGGDCASCPDHAACQSAADCQSLSCSAQTGLCLTPTCADGIQNGGEPSVDCGADCSRQCSTLANCSLDADCDSGACSEHRCVPKTATGQALPSSGWLTSASATFNQDTAPAKAIDGDLGTHWTSGSGQVPGMWFQIDLRQPHPFFALELSCTTNDDYPRGIRVLLSEDGRNFTAATPTLSGINQLHIDFGGPRIARYIKLELEQDAGSLWWRIDELQILQ